MTSKIEWQRRERITFENAAELRFWQEVFVAVATDADHISSPAEWADRAIKDLRLRRPKIEETKDPYR